MKGSVDFKSIPNKSTTVTVTMPFTIEHDSERNNQHITQPKPDTLKGLRILYTEDVKSNQFLVKTLFDVILLDVQLPDMDGFDVTTKIRSDEQSKNKKTPILLFSAHTGINDEKIKSCGANDIIGKPFQPDDLLLKIERHLQRT